MTALRLGIAGYGRLARDYYAPALDRLPEAVVTAVADPRPEGRERARARWQGVVATEDVAAMLEATELDALLVSSPPSTHRAIWRLASETGLPVFMEKPLLLADELPLLDGREDRERLMIDFNRRFWPPYLRARQRVLAGALGSPLALEFQLHLDVLGWSSVTQHRLADAEGGLVHDLGSHALDLAAWILGEPSGIDAVSESQRWPGDRLRIELAFANGSSARLDLAYAAHTRERLRIRGPQGRLWLDEPNFALHLRRAGKPDVRPVARALDLALLGYRGLWRSRSAGRCSIHGALSAFVSAVRSGGPFNPDAGEGLRNATRVAAVLRSAAVGGGQVALQPADLESDHRPTG